ncbi:membrane-spanning 4-domains subfamily A member 4A [Takifugu flavidus]|uniref:Membrane-spanning 4-domains subfamily A member 4A n=1 Tax=Takifugu flavidus TaxID=433684 RepID=A0A5C6PNH1_9TELE|nr:membrane-spanning 4-domains subfamily A member 4A [Takifugu flavidus]TWW79840.1 hypothetical protein D4764_10G0008700 [Takifugu flavidus]
MSTSLTKVGGVVVITQVIPQDEASIPLHSVPDGAQATPTTARTTPPARRLLPPTKLDELSASFLQGGPQGLGVVQIIVGVLCVLFSLRATYSPLLVLHAPLCLTVTFVVSGSLTLATLKKTSASLVWATIVSNIISVLVGVGGVAYLCFLIAIYQPAYIFCDDETWGDVTPTEEERNSCLGKIKILDASEYGSLGLLVVFLVLQVCVSITVSFFSARAIRRHGRTVTEVFDDVRPLLDAMAAAPDNSVAPAVSPR